MTEPATPAPGARVAGGRHAAAVLAVLHRDPGADPGGLAAVAVLEGRGFPPVTDPAGVGAALAEIWSDPA